MSRLTSFSMCRCNAARALVFVALTFPVVTGFLNSPCISRLSSISAAQQHVTSSVSRARSNGCLLAAPQRMWAYNKGSRIGRIRLSAGTVAEESEEDEEAAILAWKRVEKVLTEKARAEAKKKAEAKANKPKAPKPILIWDVMNTICYDPFYEEVPAFFGMSLDELYAQKDPAAWEGFELGSKAEGEALSEFFKDRRAFDHQRFVDAITARYAFLPGMEALLEELFLQGYNMHAMSNYPPWWKQLESRLNLSRFLKWTFVSSDAGIRKPDHAAFRAVESRLGVPDPAARCVLIDDSAANVAAARAAGWRAVRFEGADALRRELAALGVRLDP